MAREEPPRFERAHYDLQLWREPDERIVSVDLDWSLDSAFVEIEVDPASAERRYRFRRASDQYAALFGRDPQRLDGASLDEVLPSPLVGSLIRQLEAVVASGEAMRFLQEARFNGRPVCLVSTVVPARHEDGSVSLVATVRDVTAEMPAAKTRAAAHRMLETVFAMSSDMLALIDDHGRFQHANAAFARVLGYDPVSLVGRYLVDLLDAPSAVALGDLAVVEWGEVLPARIRTVSGHWRHVDVSVSATNETAPPSEPASYVLVARDMTAARKAGKALAQRAEMQSAVAAFGRFALQSLDIDATTERVVTIAAKVLEADAAALLHQIEPGRIRYVHSVGMEAIDLTAEIDLPPEVATAVTTTEPRIINDWRRDSRFPTQPAPLAALGIRSTLNVPVLAAERPWGMLSAHYRDARHFTLTDADFIQSLAHTLAAALERDRLDHRPVVDLRKPVYDGDHPASS
jgi:PAS domain S-box-containing protein